VTPNVALIHYWLISIRGGEKVLKEVADMFPSATIHTHVCKQSVLDQLLPGRRVDPTWVNRIPGASRIYPALLPLMALATETIPTQGVDLLLSFESGPAKGVVRPSGAFHACYCHTPMRYIWDLKDDYRRRIPWPIRPLWDLQATALRAWDRSTANEVDLFMANSMNVQKRIWAHYRRESVVVYPPVDTDFFVPDPEVPRDEYFVYLGQLSAYKRPHDLLSLVSAGFSPLKIIGSGAGKKRLAHAARGLPIEFLGRVDDEVVRRLLQGARGLLFPGEEDFGMVPVEAMACGTPVIALDAGGATETVAPGVTGIRYQEGKFDEAYGQFCEMEADLNESDIRGHAEAFGRQRFRREFLEIVTRESGLDLS
jgi:glycosyltransferase involved in cell wall biosynthesis